MNARASFATEASDDGFGIANMATGMDPVPEWVPPMPSIYVDEFLPQSLGPDAPPPNIFEPYPIGICSKVSVLSTRVG
jgi:hypothetical protein